MKNKHFHISTISLLVILAAVILNAALCFILITKPVEVDNFVGSPELNPYPDGLDWLRRLLIYPGLVFSLSALALIIKSAIGKNAAAADKILNYFIMLLTFCVGWLCIPYWANGLQYVFSGGTTSLYDPKSLIPYTDIYYAWNTMVMAFNLFAYILILIPVILAILDIRKNGFNRKYVFAAAAYALIFVSFYLAPHYMYWFLD